MIIERLEVGPFASNCYIVGDESSRQGLVVDAGAEAGRILKKLNELELDTKLIVLTHGHMDHTGAVKDVKEATGAELAIHAEDARGLQARSFSGALLHLSLKAPPPPERLLKDDDTLAIGRLRFRVLHTPGHSPGGICLLEEGVVFTGDTLFNFGIGRFDTPGGNGAQLLKSIQSKLMVLPDGTRVYPGHGPPTTIGIEREWNPFLRDTSAFLGPDQ